MAGSWGMGPLREAAQALAAAGITVLAVAGRNAELEASLLAASAAEPRIVPFGFTDRVPTLMAAADLVITSSGDTCSEARVIGRPLLLLDVVPGHGRENLQQELARGNADVAPVDPRGLCEAAVAYFERLAAEPPPPRSPATADAWEDAFAAALAELGLGGRAGSA
jgi:UDP-N-acetylglucosamine:LPS N-acetylglucosamine transferase